MQALICPRCHCPRIECRNIGRKAGSTLGTLAGVVASLSVLSGLPGGLLLAHAAGVLMKAMVSGASGCAVGAALGEVVDENILANHRCLRCGHCFSMART